MVGAAGFPDELLDAMRAGNAIVVGSTALLSACIAAGLPCDRFGFGGADYKKSFLLDEHDQLSEYVER